jgi:hypothetical protein
MVICARMSAGSVPASLARTETNSPPSSMSAPRPERRTLSLLAVKIALSRGSRSRTSARASATVSTTCVV